MEIIPEGLPFALVNTELTKKNISRLINTERIRKCGLKESVVFADKLMYTGFPFRDARRYLHRHRRHEDAG
jgi:DNA-directed RNA polymerase subunit beta'